MKNYSYIIAGLPDIVLDYGNRPLDYEALTGFIRSQCSDSDCRLIDILEAGLDGRHFTDHFYGLVERSGSRFLKEFFRFDRNVREAKVAFLEGRRLESDFADSPDYGRTTEAFEETNLIEREMKIDAMMWDKAEEITTFDLLDMDIILSFLCRAHIVRRWNALDPEVGKELFSRLVGEVRNTFKGVEYNPDQSESNNQ